jgi:pilus assembly protein Flp/PilA
MYSKPCFTAFIADERAVTAIEYGLLAALIAVAIIGGLSATGVSVTAIYNFWSTAVSVAIAGAL